MSDYYSPEQPTPEQQRDRLRRPGTEANGYVWTGREWVPKPRSTVNTWVIVAVVLAIVVAFIVGAAQWSAARERAERQQCITSNVMFGYSYVEATAMCDAYR